MLDKPTLKAIEMGGSKFIRTHTHNWVVFNGNITFETPRNMHLVDLSMEETCHSHLKIISLSLLSTSHLADMCMLIGV